VQQEVPVLVPFQDYFFLRMPYRELLQKGLLLEAELKEL
jgi:hypothetical protein